MEPSVDILDEVKFSQPRRIGRDTGSKAWFTFNRDTRSKTWFTYIYDLFDDGR